jgi:hypothetical protein
VVQNYLKQLLNAEMGIRQLVEEISGISDDWDNRSDTGANFIDTEEAMVEAIERMDAAVTDFNLIQAPPTDGFPEKHLTVASAARQIAEASSEMLAGLQSTDTGQQRQAAQIGLNAAFGVFTEGIDAVIAEYIGDDEIIGLIMSRDQTSAAPTDSEPTTTTTEASS